MDAPLLPSAKLTSGMAASAAPSMAAGSAAASAATAGCGELGGLPGLLAGGCGLAGGVVTDSTQLTLAVLPADGEPPTLLPALLALLSPGLALTASHSLLLRLQLRLMWPLALPSLCREPCRSLPPSLLQLALCKLSLLMWLPANVERLPQMLCAAPTRPVTRLQGALSQ